MFRFVKSLFALTRPLSNTKNVLIASLAFFLVGERMNWSFFITSIISVSFISSATYALNSFFDCKVDGTNKNKKHYAEAVKSLGKMEVVIIIALFGGLGALLGLFINIQFVLTVLSLFLINLLYSLPAIRFKERVLVDVLSAGFFTFALRFIAFWFAFSGEAIPILPILALGFAKSGGYMLYKEIDRGALIKKKIKNTITVLSKKAVFIIAGIFYSLAIILAIIMCFNRIDLFGALPFPFLFALPLVIIPIIVTYLKVSGRIKMHSKKLRVLGFLYGLLSLAIAIIVILKV